MIRRGLLISFLTVTSVLVVSLNFCIAGEYVVLGQPEAKCQIEAKGELNMLFVEVDDKRFGSPVPMINAGTITGLRIGNHKIELVDGKVEDGFVKTKHYGKVRILGISNPVYLWVTPEQKSKLMNVGK